MHHDPSEQTEFRGLVTGMSSGGMGFASIVGDGRTVCIPRTVMVAADLRRGDMVEGRMVDNPMEDARERTPYMAVYAQREGGGSVPPSEPVQLELPFLSRTARPAPELVAAPTPTPTPTMDVAARVEQRVCDGGLYTMQEAAEAVFGRKVVARSDEYAATVRAVQHLHRTGALARFSVTAKAGGQPRRTYYTADPANYVVTRK